MDSPLTTTMLGEAGMMQYPPSHCGCLGHCDAAFVYNSALFQSTVLAATFLVSAGTGLLLKSHFARQAVGWGLGWCWWPPSPMSLVPGQLDSVIVDGLFLAALALGSVVCSGILYHGSWESLVEWWRQQQQSTKKEEQQHDGQGEQGLGASGQVLSWAGRLLGSGTRAFRRAANNDTVVGMCFGLGVAAYAFSGAIGGGGGCGGEAPGQKLGNPILNLAILGALLTVASGLLYIR